MSAKTIRRTNARNRRGMDPSVPKKLTPAIISGIVTIAADTIHVTFNTNVFRNKLPGFTAGAGAAETVAAATEVSSTVIQLVFSGAVDATDLVVPESDPGIRTVTGGFVPAGTYAIPAAG